MSSVKTDLHVAVVGPPDSGKTTYINRVTKGEYINSPPTTSVVEVYTNSKFFRDGRVLIHLHEMPGENSTPVRGWDAALVFTGLRVNERGTRCLRPFSDESEVVWDTVPPTRIVLVCSKADAWIARTEGADAKADATDIERSLAHIHRTVSVTSSLTNLQLDRPLSLIVRMFDSGAEIVDSPPIQPPTVG